MEVKRCKESELTEEWLMPSEKWIPAVFKMLFSLSPNKEWVYKRNYPGEDSYSNRGYWNTHLHIYPKE
jgi:hypothetical protein